MGVHARLKADALAIRTILKPNNSVLGVAVPPAHDYKKNVPMGKSAKPTEKRDRADFEFLHFFR